MGSLVMEAIWSKLKNLMGLGIVGKSKNKLGNGAAFAKSKALTLADKGTNFAQKGKSKIIDKKNTAKEKLHLVENRIDQIRHTERPNTKDVAFDLEMERLKQEVEELRDIIKEAKTGFKKIKVPWYVTQFGDFILYLLIVSIISFIIIGFKEPTAMYY